MEFHELREQVAGLLSLLKGQAQHIKHRHVQDDLVEEAEAKRCVPDEELITQVAALQKRADEADDVVAALAAELRKLKHKTQDNAEAALRNRNAIATTRKQGALVAQAFQNSAAALAAAAATTD